MTYYDFMDKMDFIVLQFIEKGEEWMCQSLIRLFKVAWYHWQTNTFIMVLFFIMVVCLLALHLISHQKIKHKAFHRGWDARGRVEKEKR